MNNGEAREKGEREMMMAGGNRVTRFIHQSSVIKFFNGHALVKDPWPMPLTISFESELKSPIPATLCPHLNIQIKSCATALDISDALNTAGY